MKSHFQSSQGVGVARLPSCSLCSALVLRAASAEFSVVARPPCCDYLLLPLSPVLVVDVGVAVVVVAAFVVIFGVAVVLLT